MSDNNTPVYATYDPASIFNLTDHTHLSTSALGTKEVWCNGNCAK